MHLTVDQLEAREAPSQLPLLDPQGQPVQITPGVPLLPLMAVVGVAGVLAPMTPSGDGK